MKRKIKIKLVEKLKKKKRWRKREREKWMWELYIPSTWNLVHCWCCLFLKHIFHESWRRLAGISPQTSHNFGTFLFLFLFLFPSSSLLIFHFLFFIYILHHLLIFTDLYMYAPTQFHVPSFSFQTDYHFL